jgi:endonuclease/exonuclease/phosphatase family metal-dependent hydrolase
MGTNDKISDFRFQISDFKSALADLKSAFSGFKLTFSNLKYKSRIELSSLFSLCLCALARDQISSLDSRFQAARAEKAGCHTNSKILLRPSYGLILLLVLVFCLGAQAVGAQEAELLETGQAAQISAPPKKLKIVSYNMRWRGGQELDKLIQLWRDDQEIGGASIIALQEVDRHKKRTGNLNTPRYIADKLGLYYAWAAPPAVAKKGREAPEEETGVAVLSHYPLSDATRIVLPNPAPDGKRRVALGVTVKIGDTVTRIYSVHAEVKIESQGRLEQLRAVLEDLKRNYPTARPAAIMGDFNTYSRASQADAANLFLDNGFTTPFPHDEATWHTFILELKLDWLWLRGFNQQRHGIDRAVGLSDHWPLWTDVQLIP